MKQKVKKIVLAYSGGLDSSVILHWLRNKYDCEVTFGFWINSVNSRFGNSFSSEPAKMYGTQRLGVYVFAIKFLY